MFKLRPPSTRLRWQALAVALGVLAVVATSKYTPLGTLNLYFQDGLLRLTTVERLPDNFVLLAIDEKSRSLDDLEPGELAQSESLRRMKNGYPWPREVYAALIDKLFAAGAKLVVFDMVFAGSKEGDLVFAEALAKHPGRVIIGTSLEANIKGGPTSEPLLLPPSRLLSEATGSQTTLVNFPAWEDTKIRSVPVRTTQSELVHLAPVSGEATYLSLSAAAAQSLGAKLPDASEGSPLRFRYSRPGTMKQFPIYQVFVPAFWNSNLQGGAVFKDSVVLIGATATIMHDSLLTPWGTLSGPEVHLHALAAFLRHSFIAESGQAASFVSVALAALAVIAAALIRRHVVVFAIGLILAAAGWLVLCAASLHFFSYFLPVSPPFLTILTCGFAVLICDVTLERQERNRVRGFFSLYVSKDVVQEILDNRESFLRNLGGQRQEVVVLFSDLKGFTSDSEKLDAADLLNLLNEYFGEMVDVVFKHRGTFDKFIGDALMATWGGIRKATPQEDARQALQTAFEMKVRLASLNERRHARGLASWGSGIGICQGPAIFGNIGSHERREPTVIGDTVNLASRIEGLTRIYGVDLLVSETLASNTPPELGLLLIDTVRVKGRRTPEKLFHPYEKASLDPAWIAAFEAAREKYVVGDFAAAATTFAALSHEKGGLTALSHFYRVRSEGLIADPRPDWQGIWEFTEK